MADGPTALVIPGVACCMAGGVLWIVSKVQKQKVDDLKELKELTSLQDVKKLVTALPAMVAVRGKAWAKSPISLDGDHRPAVIVRVDEYRMEWTPEWPRMPWIPGVRSCYKVPLRRAEREVPWCLEDDSGLRLPVLEGRSADPLDLVHLGQLNPFSRSSVLEWLFGLDAHRYRTYTTEEALPVGTTMTAIGELCTAPAGSHVPPGAVLRGDDVLVLQKPQRRAGPFMLQRSTLKEIIAQRQWLAKMFEVAGTGFFLVGGGLMLLQLVRSMRRWHRSWKAKRMRDALRRHRQSQRAANAAAAAAAGGGAGEAGARAAEPPADDGVEAGTCVVCFTNRCDTVFPLCGHVCTCQACSRTLVRCPVCRTKGRVIRIYHI